MSGYILAVAGAVLLSAALSVILPGGKTGAFLKGMCRLAVFAVLVAPLISMMTKKEFSFEVSGIGEDEGYLTACARLLSERDEKEIAAFLQEDYGLSAAAEVERAPCGGFPLSKIKVNLSESGIIGQDEHINIADCIQAALAEKYGCERSAVEVVWED